MVKKVLYFFLILIIFVPILKPPFVSAADTCSSAIGPVQNPQYISPGVTTKVDFKFSNLPKGKNYYLLAWYENSWYERDFGTGLRSDQTLPSDNTGSVTLSFSANNNQGGDYLLRPTGTGRYRAILKAQTSGSNFVDFCEFSFMVGFNFTYESCVTDGPYDVQVGQDIIVNISKAPDKPITFLDPITTIQQILQNWRWPVFFSGDSLTVYSEGQPTNFIRIAADGTGTFIIPKFDHETSSELYLTHPPDKGYIINWLNSGVSILAGANKFCKTTLTVRSSSKDVEPSCKINPATPTTDGNTSITAVNLSKNASFWPVLSAKSISESDCKLITLGGKQSNDQGYIQFPLGKKSEGIHYAAICDVNNKVVCQQSFTVGLPQTPVDLAKIRLCGVDGVKCPESGGDPCGTDPKNPGFKTAIGCIHTNPVEFVKDALRFILAISGGLAFLMMLLGAFQMLTSAGNPDSLNAGRERLTSAVIGLLLVIFAVLLMQIIGVGILDIPGFKP